MNVLEEIGKMFAEDIKEFIANGGSLEDLDPVKVYGLDKKEEEKE